MELFGIELPRIEIKKVKKDKTYWCEKRLEKFSVKIVLNKPHYHEEHRFFVYASGKNKIDVQKEPDDLAWDLRHMGIHYKDFIKLKSFSSPEEQYAYWLRMKRRTKRNKLIWLFRDLLDWKNK